MASSARLQIKQAVQTVLTDETVTKAAICKSLLLKSNIWDLIEQFLPVLRPLAKAAAIMCAEQHVGLSFIYPVIMNLLDSNLKPTDSDMGATLAFKAEVSKQLNKRFKLDQQGLAETLPIMSCLWDPRFKHLQFLQNDVREAAKHHLSELVLNLNQSRSCDSAAATCRPCDGDASESATADAEPQKKKSTIEMDYAEMFGRRFEEGRKSRSATDDSKINDYLKLTPHIPTMDNLLLWWKKRKDQYLHLAALARKYLATFCTSTPSWKYR
ncbi:UNVERIFIED_CONTAM: hypothetical protein FKN15_009648 [Acipenser sinensis]